MVRRAALVCLAFALAGCSAASSTTSSPAATVSASSVAPTSVPPSTEPPSSPKPAANLTIDVPKPGAVVAAFGSIWVQSRQNGAVWRIDRNGKVVAKIPHVIRSMKNLGWESSTLGAGYGSVWALGDGVVARIDPGTNKVVSKIVVPDYAFGLAVGEGAVWVACCAGGPPGSGVWPRLIRIDPETEAAPLFVKTLTSPSSFAVGSGYVWWGNFSEAGAMQRIDPATGAQVRIEASNMRFIVPTQRWIWLLSSGSSQRLATGSVAPAKDAGRKGPIAIGATYADGMVWINAGDVIGFDADTGKVRVTIDLQKVSWQATGGIAKLGSRIWVADPGRSQIVGVPID
jgi:hypothetical protein